MFASLSADYEDELKFEIKRLKQINAQLVEALRTSVGLMTCANIGHNSIIKFQELIAKAEGN